MSLIYITGPTGAGKTTIGEELQSRGYLVFDTDKDGIRFWINNQTGEPNGIFLKDEQHSKQWLNDNKVGLPKNWLAMLKAKHIHKFVFICGTSPADHIEAGIYDKVICLVIDEQTLIHRVKSRTNNQYGKGPSQLEKAIKWRQATIDRYKNAGALEIDAAAPLEIVVEKILQVVT